MSGLLTAAQLTGRDESHLVELPCGQRLQPAVARDLDALRRDARDAGFDLAVASGFRSFGRQLTIWNGKACGERPVHDDQGLALDLACLSPDQQLHAILRFSALPGASRHHWGTDLDVFDAAAMPEGYQLQLSPQEVAPGGLFDDFHNWLDDRIARAEAHGFYRPYAEDRGGVAPERWHLSHAPLSQACAGQLDAQILQQSWDDSGETLSLRTEVESQLATIIERYVIGMG
ncbi:MAG: M15 family metallopeptidase [Halioglobus sp.]